MKQKLDCSASLSGAERLQLVIGFSREQALSNPSTKGFISFSLKRKTMNGKRLVEADAFVTSRCFS